MKNFLLLFFSPKKTTRYAGGEKSLSIKTSFDRIESVPAETKAKEVFIPI